ncbi:hypothetical protein [Mesorhizobium sp. M1399]|uniref:hypothetical protein n=1 Tax=Mesorhizobium sp. M1399 TaxID=2957096 RepID=UPI003338DEBE
MSEIAINRPGELFIERLGAKEMEHVVKREVTPGWIRNISTGVASATNQVINEEKPVLSAALPSGEHPMHLAAGGFRRRSDFDSQAGHHGYEP